MQKLSIDLLPIEFKAQALKRVRFYKIQAIGVAIILLTTFLSALVVSLRILQSQQIVQVQARLSEAEQKISSRKNTQASLLLLKNRLTTINQYLGTPSKQSRMYNLITKLLPAAVSINTISVDKSGEALVLATIPDGNYLDSLIDNLISKESNEDKIKGVSIESLSRGKEGIYRISFKIKPR